MANRQANDLLGYPPDARLLIINADDFGMSHAINAGILRSLTEGVARSATLMAPCPWALHAMRLLRDHSNIAFGVHLTVVAEFADYRWGPLSPRHEVPSLLDETGSFFSNDRQAELLARARLDEIEIEFRAQVETVLSTGLRPTHLDWHCLYDGGRPDIFDLTLGLANEYGLALRVFDPTRSDQLQRWGLPAVDHGVVDSTELATAGKTARFVRMLRELPAGLSEWAVHPGLGTAEARAIDGWWSKRAADLRFLVSPEARETVAAEGIVLLDYRPLQAIWDCNRARHPAWATDTEPAQTRTRCHETMSEGIARHAARDVRRRDRCGRNLIGSSNVSTGSHTQCGCLFRRRFPRCDFACSSWLPCCWRPSAWCPPIPPAPSRFHPGHPPRRSRRSPGS